MTKTKTAPRASASTQRAMSDDAVQKATGKTWPQWFAALDKAGAAELDHRGIVAIAAKHGAGPWWQQMVTVEYERARGLRAKHETTSGFSVSRSKTLDVPIAELYAACAEPKRRAKWLPEPKLVVHKATPNRSMRVTWTDGVKSVELMFYAKGASKAQVTVQHSKLPDAKAAERMKTYWSEALERLARQLAP
jgi:uncharacterized protein YndB with AHSA1/START domain